MALDLFLFFRFLEIVLVPMYFLIAKWAARPTVRGRVLLHYTMFGSAFMLVDSLATAFLHARAVDGSADIRPADDRGDAVLSITTGRWIFLASRWRSPSGAAVFPVHTCCPMRTPKRRRRSVILAGIMLKLVPTASCASASISFRGRGVLRARPDHARSDRHHHGASSPRCSALSSGGPYSSVANLGFHHPLHLRRSTRKARGWHLCRWSPRDFEPARCSSCRMIRTASHEGDSLSSRVFRNRAIMAGVFTVVMFS